MKILLTGASSFTGTWFAMALQAAGHQVVATLQAAADKYTDRSARRLALLHDVGVTFVQNCSFGDERFLECMQDEIDVICHHGAQVTDYKNMDFDFIAAIQSNTKNARQVVEAAVRHGVRAIVLTGSVFEQDEGLGTESRRAFSPYGLSKGLSWQIFRYWGEQIGYPVHKFVIPNPFGPHEEPRFCAYLMSKWSKGDNALISTPDYIRDNIHVTLLASSYCEFVEHATRCNVQLYLGPSGYIESQGAFAMRFAREIGRRLGLKATITFGEQKDFIEPEMRVNSNRPKSYELGWNESHAWDDLADYYHSIYLA
jgi:nucleoside-diphosphate-sugar epimerase